MCYGFLIHEIRLGKVLDWMPLLNCDLHFADAFLVLFFVMFGLARAIDFEFYLKNGLVPLRVFILIFNYFLISYFF